MHTITASSTETPFSSVSINTTSGLKSGPSFKMSHHLNENPNVRILVEGYCDWKGTPAYNKSLGDRRATSVKDYLVDLGVEDNRIEILSMGDELATPDADPTTAGLERKAQLKVRRDS